MLIKPTQLTKNSELLGPSITPKLNMAKRTDEQNMRNRLFAKESWNRSTEKRRPLRVETPY